MKFILLFGPQAVGKMTVGRELEKITDLKLFHNHMTIEMLEPIFGFGPDLWRLSDMFREEIFKTVAKSDQYGLIFTYVWAFDQQADWDFVENVCNIFEANGAEVILVELEADIDERLWRNKTPNRLDQKPTKRNVEVSERNLVDTMKKHRLNSIEGEIVKDQYLRINNTNLSAYEVASQIKKCFHLE
ncbi:AAA family ATPase [Aquibacillus koreensis]|uniref:AAA family ATPase n=1 Tax=Aquibacillus koreensis TaxID=279446 RepID=A0A9X3WML6_9BACI|nr:AAA family ATPase [Aquibacillus koreensis]MCT2537687.1 AAA family ATPase [Aquibacillus koreensis]MDC3420966.1 AAA family ATPase [Aquibacillus koreensis]